MLDAVSKGLSVTAAPSGLIPPVNSTFADVGWPPGGQCSYPDIPVANNPKGYSGPCTWMSSDPSAARIALIGDSHATPQWSFAFLKMAQALHDSFGLFAREGCQVGVDLWQKLPRPLGGPPQNQCSDLAAQVVKFVNQFNSNIVVIAARTKNIPAYTPEQNKIFTEGLSSLISELKAPGRKIYVFSDNPRTYGGPQCLSAHSSDTSICNAPVSYALSSESQDVVLRAVKDQGVSLINEIPWLCTSTRCPVIIANHQVYKDVDHITSSYCEYLVPVLEASLGLNGDGTRS